MKRFIFFLILITFFISGCEDRNLTARTMYDEAMDMVIYARDINDLNARQDQLDEALSILEKISTEYADTNVAFQASLDLRRFRMNMAEWEKDKQIHLKNQLRTVAANIKKKLEEYFIVHQVFPLELDSFIDFLKLGENPYKIPLNLDIFLKIAPSGEKFGIGVVDIKRTFLVTTGSHFLEYEYGPIEPDAKAHLASIVAGEKGKIQRKEQFVLRISDF